MLPEAGAKERSAESARYATAMRAVAPLASLLRHEPVLLICDGDEALLQCARCEALEYVDIVGGPFLGGSLLEEECRHEEAPGETPLTFLLDRGYGRSRPAEAVRSEQVAGYENPSFKLMLAASCTDCGTFAKVSFPLAFPLGKLDGRRAGGHQWNPAPDLESRPLRP